MKRALLSGKAAIINACFIVLMFLAINLVLDAKIAHSFPLSEPDSILRSSLVGTWEETDAWIGNKNLIFYPDGRVTLSPFHLDNMRYIVKDGFIIMTITTIWGKNESAHKASITGNILTVDPGMFLWSEFRRVK